MVLNEAQTAPVSSVKDATFNQYAFPWVAHLTHTRIVTARSLARSTLCFISPTVEDFVHAQVWKLGCLAVMSNIGLAWYGSVGAPSWVHHNWGCPHDSDRNCEWETLYRRNIVLLSEPAAVPHTLSGRIFLHPWRTFLFLFFLLWRQGWVTIDEKGSRRSQVTR